MLSGSLADVVKAFIDNPSSIETLLGRSIPGVGAYFLQLLTVKATVSIAVEAARPIPLARELSLRRLMERRDPIKGAEAGPRRAADAHGCVGCGAVRGDRPFDIGAGFSIFLARGARLPEAFPISIYKNERGRRRGAVSGLSACFSLSLGIGQLARVEIKFQAPTT